MRTTPLQNPISGQLSIWRLLLAAGLNVLLLSACAVAPSADTAHSAPAGLPESELAAYASAPRLDFSTATVLLDNEDAFEQKLQAVRNARKSLDPAYYIFADDYSSSLLAQESVAAARCELVRPMISWRPRPSPRIAGVRCSPAIPMRKCV